MVLKSTPTATSHCQEKSNKPIIGRALGTELDLEGSPIDVGQSALIEVESRAGFESVTSASRPWGGPVCPACSVRLMLV